MSNVALTWQQNDREQVAIALKELFILQRKPIRDEELPVFISRLSAKKYLQPHHVISGIRSLEEVELNALTLRTIVDAANHARSESIGDSKTKLEMIL